MDIQIEHHRRVTFFEVVFGAVAAGEVVNSGLATHAVDEGAGSREDSVTEGELGRPSFPCECLKVVAAGVEEAQDGSVGGGEEFFGLFAAGGGDLATGHHLGEFVDAGFAFEDADGGLGLLGLALAGDGLDDVEVAVGESGDLREVRDAEDLVVG